MQETHLMERPICPANLAHGHMDLRTRLTKEQAWCGTWYDCVGHDCRASVLLESIELKERHGVQRFAHVPNQETAV